MTKVTLVIRSGGCPPSAQDRAQFRAQKRAAANNVSLASTARKAYELANQGPALAVRDLAESWRQPIANYRNHIEQACTATAFDAMELAREMEQEARNYCLSACSIADALIHQHQDTLRIIRSNWLEGLEERRRESIESELIENGTEPRRARRIADAPTLEIAEILTMNTLSDYTRNLAEAVASEGAQPIYARAEEGANWTPSACRPAAPSPGVHLSRSTRPTRPARYTRPHWPSAP